MMQLLRGGRSDNEAFGDFGEDARHWRQVPKVNLLPKRRRTVPTALILRTILLVVLLLEGALIWDRVSPGESAPVTGLGATSRMRSELQALKTQVATAQEEQVALGDELTQLQEQRNATEVVNRGATEGHLNWTAALSALFSIERDRNQVRFDSVATEPGGVIILQGLARDLKTMAGLQNQLRGISQVLDLTGIEWETLSDSLRFTATFQVSG